MKRCVKPTGLTGPSQEHNIAQWELWEVNRKKKVYKEITLVFIPIKTYVFIIMESFAHNLLTNINVS